MPASNLELKAVIKDNKITNKIIGILVEVTEVYTETFADKYYLIYSLPSLMRTSYGFVVESIDNIDMQDGEISISDKANVPIFYLPKCKETISYVRGNKARTETILNKLIYEYNCYAPNKEGINKNLKYGCLTKEIQKESEIYLHNSEYSPFHLLTYSPEEALISEKPQIVYKNFRMSCMLKAFNMNNNILDNVSLERLLVNNLNYYPNDSRENKRNNMRVLSYKILLDYYVSKLENKPKYSVNFGTVYKGIKDKGQRELRIQLDEVNNKIKELKREIYKYSNIRTFTERELTCTYCGYKIKYVTKYKLLGDLTSKNTKEKPIYKSCKYCGNQGYMVFSTNREMVVNLTKEYKSLLTLKDNLEQNVTEIKNNDECLVYAIQRIEFFEEDSIRKRQRRKN